MDSQHFARQRLVPMLHQLEVSAVVAADIFDAVGELLPTREQLLEVPEAAGHGLTARVDDLRIRVHEVDKTDVPEIVRHLVDEPRLSGPIDPGVVQIFVGEAQEFCGRQLREHRGISRRF